MTWKVFALLFVLLAIGLAVPLEQENVLPSCDCGTVTGVLMKSVGKIQTFLGTLLPRALTVTGCGFTAAVRLVANFTYETLHLLSALFGLAVPPVPEQPHEACPGFKNLTNEFRELILEVIVDDDEVKRCDCKVPTPLKDFVTWLLNLLKTVLKYLAGGEGSTTVIPGAPPSEVPLPVRL
uniref:Saposin B-type domain-containing protein n=1 Tax=Steinernema glaseri TaxID=37863 RepID=A0A1I8AKB7_9BILA